MVNAKKNRKVAVKRRGKHTSADIHAALFGSEKPAKRTLKELKAAIGQYMRERHSRWTPTGK